MRVAVLHYTGPPVPGGVESVMREHARLLCQAGHEVTIVAGQGRALRGATFQRVPLMSATHPTQLGIARSLAQGNIPSNFDAVVSRLSEGLESALKSQDLVIVHNAFTLHFNQPLTVALSVLSERSLRDRTVAWTHDIAAVNSLYQSEMHEGYPWNLLRSPQAGVHYVCISKQRRDELLAVWRANGQQVEITPQVIPNGIDVMSTLKLSPSVAEFVRMHRLLDRNVILLLPVRLTRRKNIEVAIDVLSRIRRRGVDAVLLLTGVKAPHHPARSDAYKHELEEHSVRSGVAREVLFVTDLVGHSLSDHEVIDLYALSDVLILPSRSEGFGLPLLEAMAHRLPIVASDIPVFRELAAGGGRFFDLATDTDEIAEMVLDAASEPLTRMRRGVVREYDWGSVYRHHIYPLLSSLDAGISS